MTEEKIDDEIWGKEKEDKKNREKKKGGRAGITGISKMEMKRFCRGEMEAGSCHPVFSQN